MTLTILMESIRNRVRRKNRFRLNKKGDVTDPLIFVVILAVLGIALIFLVFTGRQISAGLNVSPLNESEQYNIPLREGLDTMNDRTLQMGYLFFMGFFALGIILSAFLSGEHPIFIFLFFIFTMFAIFLSAIFANVYGALIDNVTLAEGISDQGVFDFAFRRMPFITMAIGGFGMFVLLARVFRAPSGNVGGGF